MVTLHEVILFLVSMQISITAFFFQAEDGIRDYKVTGVQTCALPISPGHTPELGHRLERRSPAVGPVELADHFEVPAAPELEAVANHAALSGAVMDDPMPHVHRATAAHLGNVSERRDHHVFHGGV